MLYNRLILIGLMAVLSSSLVLAQPATAPADPPATRPRHVVKVPPGFQTVEINQRNVILEPADEPWIRQSLAAHIPASMPSTMPSDLVGQLTASKTKIRTEMIELLALPDPKPIDEFLNDKLPAVLKMYDNITPPLFYMVTSDERIKALLKSGWSDPRFHYSASANAWALNGRLDMSVAGRADDVLLPYVYFPENTVEERKERFSRLVANTEKELVGSISEQAMAECRLGLLTFFAGEMNDPVRGHLDREWVAVGLAGVLGSRYTALLTGVPYDKLIRDISAEGNHPMPQTAVDLIHPPADKDMRVSTRPLFLTAHRRKSVRIMHAWHVRAGDSAIPRLLTEMRKNPPADGTALLAQIKQVSGIDLSGEVGLGK